MIVLLFVDVMLQRHINVVMFLCVCSSTFEVLEHVVRETKHLLVRRSSIHLLRRIHNLLRVGHGRHMIGMSDHLDVYRLIFQLPFHFFADRFLNFCLIFKFSLVFNVARTECVVSLDILSIDRLGPLFKLARS